MPCQGQTDLLLGPDGREQERLPGVQEDLERVRGHIGDVCADKADSRRENAKLFSRMGGKPFLMRRSNASRRAKGSYAWKQMMLFREERPQEFEGRYHKRSNAESANSSLKGKYGEFLRAGSGTCRRGRWA